MSTQTSKELTLVFLAEAYDALNNAMNNHPVETEAAKLDDMMSDVMRMQERLENGA